MYLRWVADQMWTFVPARQIVGKFIETFREFPHRQPVASLRPDTDAVRKYLKTQSVVLSL